MIKTAEVIRLVTVASILTLAVGAGAAMAKPADAMSVTDTIVAEKAADAAAPADASAGCARKVKVVYVGYGEASRAGCVASAATAAR